MPVRFRVNGQRLYSHGFERTNDAAGYRASIRYQNFFKHKVLNNLREAGRPTVIAL